MAGARVNELRFLLIFDSNVDFLSVEEGRNERKRLWLQPYMVITRGGGK